MQTQSSDAGDPTGSRITPNNWRRRGDGTPRELFGLGAGACVIAPDGRLLMIEQERGGVVAWGIPGGGVEAGETLGECAVRETFEETGLRVRLGRLLSVDHYRYGGILVGVGCVYLAEPDGWPQEPALPDADGSTRLLGHRWFARDEIAALRIVEGDLPSVAWPEDIITPLERVLDFPA